MKRLPGGADAAMREMTRWTEARLGLGRVGASATTEAVLEFAMDHARARDAIHRGMDVGEVERDLHGAGFQVLRAQSQARDRAEYLRRPDLGRFLDEASKAELRAVSEAPADRLTVVVGDGLSALAPRLNAVPLLEALRRGLSAWTLDAVVVATQARVALGDDVGEARGAEAVIVLIGERAGLRAFDSLGAYLTYRPRVGRIDAERNCVSNIREAGLGPEEAAGKLLYLLAGARALRASGVGLKEDAGGSGTLAGGERGLPGG